MRAPLKLRLEYLASTYGIDNLGLAWIQTNPDGSRSLVLSPVPEGVTLIGSSADAAIDFAANERWLRDEVTG